MTRSRKKVAALCMQCEKAPFRYKCPACQIYQYCSVDCFRQHQTTCNRAAEKKSQGASKTVAPLTQEPVEGSLSANLSESEKAKLVADAAIVSALATPELQAIIRSINASQHREMELQRVIASNEDFAIFVNQILTILRPDLGLDQTEEDDEEEETDVNLLRTLLLDAVERKVL